jgi:hypothetical protein
MCGANATSFDAYDAVGVRRIDSLVRRRSWVEKENPFATYAKRQMRMTVEHGVNILAGKRAEGAIDSEASAAGVAVHDANARGAGFDKNAVAEFHAQLFAVVIPRDGEDRSDFFEQFDRDTLRQIAAMQDGLHLRFDQTAYERRRQDRSKTRQVRIGHDAEDELAT